LSYFQVESDVLELVLCAMILYLYWYHSSGPGLGLSVPFCNMLRFYGEELLAPCPTTRLEDHYQLAAHNFLFSILTANEYLEAVCIHKLKRCHTMVMGPLIMDVVTVWLYTLMV
jgi:hypothetical protein